jgi:hypothetical protein
MTTLFKKIARFIICLPIIGLMACGGGQESSNRGVPVLTPIQY